MVLLVTVVMLLAFGSMAEATVGAKQIKVDYNNILIYADGKAVSLGAGQEPFLLNGVTYVPLRVAGEALNSTVNWQSETKTIQISTGTTAEIGSLKLQLTAKEQEIADLKKQVNDLQKQLADKQNRKYDLRDLEDELLDEFDELEDVTIEDIKLDGDEDDVEVEIEVNLRYYDDEWEDLRDRDIERWLEDLVEYIQDELTEDTVVEGVIIDIYDDEELVEFYKDGEDDLEVDFNDYRGNSNNASDVADELLNDRYYVEDLRFAISYINYDEVDEEVIVHLDAEDNDCSEQWNDLSSRTIGGAVEDICEDIAWEFEDEDVDVETVRVYLYDEDDYLLDSFRYDV